MSSNRECVKEQLPFSIWQRGKFIYRKIIKQYIRASEGITKERHVFNWPSRHNSSLESEWKVFTFICSFSGIFKALIPWGLSIFFLKAQCTARAANRLNTSPLTHAHMKTPRNKHVHTHINQDLLWQWLFCPFVSLLPSLLQRSAEQDRFTCISWELCRWASYGLLAAFIFFSIRHIEKLWTYTKTKNGGTAVDPEKGRIQLHLPFL